MSKSPVVTVIGAGVSGIKAAVDLTKAGIKVVMLEARDRTGGRIRTVHPTNEPDVHYDFGASWLHETLENELFPYCIEKKVDLYYDDGAIVFYYKGQPLKPEEKSLRVLSDLIGSAKLEASKELSAAHDEERPAAMPNLKDYAQKWVQKFPLISDYNKQVIPELARNAELYIGVPWEKISIEASGGAAGLGRDAFVLPGYTSVLDHVFNEINKDNFELHLNEEVVSIDDNDSKVTVVTSSGKEFVSDYAVVTVPSILLKNIQFKKPLPAKLRASIDNASFATLSKAIFEFDTVFWKPEIDRMFVLGDSTSSDGLTPGAAPVLFVNGYNLWKRPVLITILAPPLSDYLEKNPKDAFKYLLPQLQAVRADSSSEVPQPTNVYVTDWSLQKYSGGSYSAILAGQDGQEIIQSYKDGAGKVRFAGEHTVFEGDGCVHGAFASGKREAAYIIKQLGQSKSQ